MNKMNIKQLPNASTPEGTKAIQAVKAMQYLHSKNIAYSGMDEDEILALAKLTMALTMNHVSADASIQNDNFVKLVQQHIEAK